MYNIGVVTATRAEYGLLKNTIRAVTEDNELELLLFVTGAHLRREYGYTVQEIEDDGFAITEKIDILDEGDSVSSICKSMGRASLLFSDVFLRHKPDALIVLGDRYELLPICSVAMNYCIPIVHISGGETTEGAVDDAVRHCVTKLSYLHFPGCEEYRKRIIQMGESPDRVFNYGDVGVENILQADFLSKDELEKSINYKLDKPYFSVTFHPVTLEKNTAKEQIAELLAAIEKFPQYKFIFSKANADTGGQVINRHIEDFSALHENCAVFESLGIKRYLSLLKYSDGVIGNSSSGIVEAPLFHIPTINIGDRQKGRLRVGSIIDVEPERGLIEAAIEKSRTAEFRKICSSAKSPYEGGNTSEKIISTLKDFLKNNKIDLKKKFYDMDIKCEV